MDVNTLRIAATVASFVTFIAICAWTWSRSRRGSLEEAGRIPFQQD